MEMHWIVFSRWIKHFCGGAWVPSANGSMKARLE